MNRVYACPTVLLLILTLYMDVCTGVARAAPAGQAADVQDMEKVGTWSTENVVDIAVLDDQAFVARYFDSSSPVMGYLSTVDISDPGSPGEIISARLEANDDELFTAGHGDENRLYAAETQAAGCPVQIRVFSRESGEQVCA